MTTSDTGAHEGPKNDGNKGNANDDAQLEVATPNGVFRGSFDKNDKIKDVIDAIVEDRGLTEGDAFELYFGDVHLTPVNRPLASFGLKGKVKLSLVATGSGV